MENLIKTPDLLPALNNAIFCLILYIFIKIFFKKDSISKIQKRLDNDEYLICDITPIFFFDYALAFTYGYGFEKIFSNIILNDAFYVMLELLFVLAGAFLLTVLASPKIFISNKRIICEPGFLPLVKKENKRKYHYCNIKNCREKWTFLGKKFIIDFKTASKPLVMFRTNTFHYNTAKKVIIGAYESVLEGNIKHKKQKEEYYAKAK